MMDGSDVADAATLLRRAIERNIAAADALGLPLVAIWLEHARRELGPHSDREPSDGEPD